MTMRFFLTAAAVLLLLRGSWCRADDIPNEASSDQRIVSPEVPAQALTSALLREILRTAFAADDSRDPLLSEQRNDRRPSKASQLLIAQRDDERDRRRREDQRPGDERRDGDRGQGERGRDDRDRGGPNRGNRGPDRRGPEGRDFNDRRPEGGPRGPDFGGPGGPGGGGPGGPGMGGPGGPPNPGPGPGGPGNFGPMHGPSAGGPGPNSGGPGNFGHVPNQGPGAPGHGGPGHGGPGAGPMGPNSHDGGRHEITVHIYLHHDFGGAPPAAMRALMGGGPRGEMRGPPPFRRDRPRDDDDDDGDDDDDRDADQTDDQEIRRDESLRDEVASLRKDLRELSDLVRRIANQQRSQRP